MYREISSSPERDRRAANEGRLKRYQNSVFATLEARRELKSKYIP